MVRGEKAKTASLVLTALCLVAYLLLPLLPFNLSQVGLYGGCTLQARLAYSFFHASFFHLAGNCWVLLCLVFYYEVPVSRLLVSYIVAVSAPALSAVPTVGLSAVVYCLLGQISFMVRRKLYFHVWVIISILAFGVILPDLMEQCGTPVVHPNNFLHIYCYVVGLLVGFLNSPISLWQRRR